MEGDTCDYSSPSRCFLHYCEEEVFIACPHCLEFVCYSHIDDHDCRKLPSQYCESKRQQTTSEEELAPTLEDKLSSGESSVEGVKAVGMLELYMVVKIIFEYLQKFPKTFLRSSIVTEFFSQETLTMLSKRNLKWYLHIGTNRLWQKFCYYPENYWTGIERPSILEKQTLRPFCKLRYIYDHQCLLLNNWEIGHFKITEMFHKLKKIMFMEDYIDNSGRHWLFITDGYKVDIWDIRNKPKHHTRFEIVKSSVGVVLRKIRIILSNGKLFVTRGTFVEVYEFVYPNYILQHLHGFFCDECFKLPSEYLQTGVPWFDDIARKTRKNFCVHVFDSTIIGHSCEGPLCLHVWDATTGIKRLVVKYNPSHPNSNISSIDAQSKLCSKKGDILLKVSVTLHDKTSETSLFVSNVKIIKDWIEKLAGTTDFSETGLISTTDFSEMGLISLPESRPIVFFDQISTGTIVTCRQLPDELKFHLRKQKGDQWDNISSFTIPCHTTREKNNLKIHLFKEKGLLVVAINHRQIRIVDLKSLKEKKLCKVTNVRRLYFINPKFVLYMYDKPNIAEIWDAEIAQAVRHLGLTFEPGDENVENETKFHVKVTWHEMPWVPPKVLVSCANRINIVDFDV